MPYKDRKKHAECHQRWLAKGDNKEKQREYQRLWRLKNLEREKAKSRAYTSRIKHETLMHYGGCCVCCGEKEFTFLSIDHINGGGNKHREALNRRGWRFYLWLRDNGYPAGFQVLCMNCQFGKQLLGTCPHQTKSLLIVERTA